MKNHYENVNEEKFLPERVRGGNHKEAVKRRKTNDRLKSIYAAISKSDELVATCLATTTSRNRGFGINVRNTMS